MFVKFQQQYTNKIRCTLFHYYDYCLPPLIGLPFKVASSVTELMNPLIRSLCLRVTAVENHIHTTLKVVNKNSSNYLPHFVSSYYFL